MYNNNKCSSLPKKKGLMLLKINDPLTLFDRKFQQYTDKHQQKCLLRNNMAISLQLDHVKKPRQSTKIQNNIKMFHYLVLLYYCLLGRFLLRFFLGFHFGFRICVTTAL